MLLFIIKLNSFLHIFALDHVENAFNPTLINWLCNMSLGGLSAKSDSLGSWLHCVKIVIYGMGVCHVILAAIMHDYLVIAQFQVTVGLKQKHV